MGLKAPRGYGWLTNPKRAAYNRIYNRTSRGCLVSLIILILLFSGLIAHISFAGGHGSSSHSTAGRTVHVNGYYRKDGTYVQPYDRAAPGTGTPYSTTSEYRGTSNAATASTAATSVPAVPDSASVRVHSYYKQNGTYVQEYVRSAPGTADAVISTTTRKPVNTAAVEATALATTATVAASTHTPHSYSSSSAAGIQRDSHGRIKRSESAKHDFMRMTGYPNGRPGYVVDHIIPLKRGGCDCPSNMQWQAIQEAKAKDKWE